MPKLGRSKKTNRDCLVCGTTTTVAHMGIDVCRACTVFYRRADGKAKKYACRSGTGRCSKGKDLNCKKCRLRHIKHVLLESCSTDEVSPAFVPTLPLTIEQPSFDAQTSAQNLIQQDTSPTWSTDSRPSAAEALPLLTKVAAAYEKLCYGRLMGELFSRKDTPHPTQNCSTNHPVFCATFATMNDANRVLMSCIIEFGQTTFPEFGQLSKEEQWSIAVKYFYTFRKIDNSYRAEKRFPGQKTKIFCAFTLILSEEAAYDFFVDFPEGKGDVEEARKMIMNVCHTRNHVGRNTIDRMRPDEYEFLAMISMLFWATNGLEASEEFTRISENYRQQISSELHVYYRDFLKLDNYASRIGELFSFLPMFENYEKIKETFEVFRLLDIFSDDTFTYKLTKA